MQSVETAEKEALGRGVRGVMVRLGVALVLGAALAATVVDARGRSKKASKTKRAGALDRPIPPSAGRPTGSSGQFGDKLSDRELKEHLRSLVAQYDGDEARVAELLDSVLEDDKAARDLLPIKSTEDKFDAKYIILGAGPGGTLPNSRLATRERPHASSLLTGESCAGIQLGYYMQQDQQDYLILEKGPSAGTFYTHYPRHRGLISINKRYAGADHGHEFHLRHDWNSLISDDPSMLMKEYSADYYPHADRLVEYLSDFTSKFDLKVRYNTHITDIRRPPGMDTGFQLTSSDGTVFKCEYLIDVTGVANANVPKDMVGYELAEHYEDFNIDPKNYTDQKVLIVGKGNAAFEIATELMSEAAEVLLISRNPVKLAPFTHYPGDLRVVNDEALGAYQLKSLVSILDTDAPILNTSIKLTVEYNKDGFWKGTRPYRFTHERIGGSPDLYRKRSSVYDRVIMSSGFVSDTSYYDESIAPERCSRDKYPVSTPAYESVNVPGLFFAGTKAHYRDYRKSSGGFIHGFRYTARSLHRWLGETTAKRMWPMTAVRRHPKQITERVMERVGTSSGLYQMFSELTELLVVSGSPKSKPGEFLGYLEEVPIALIPELLEHSNKVNNYKPAEGERLQFYTVTLEYGRCFKEESVITRHLFCSNPSCYTQTNLLHVVVRYYDYKDIEEMKAGCMTKPLRQFHITEDLNTDWKDRDMYWLPLATFLSQTLGMTQADSPSVPLLVAERDLSQPLPDCELSKVGDLMFTKYERLIDTNPELAHFFLLQALKFKPELGQKHWDGKELDQTMDLLQEKANGVARCTTPSTNVGQCVMEVKKEAMMRDDGSDGSTPTAPSPSDLSYALELINSQGALTQEQYLDAKKVLNITDVDAGMPRQYDVLNNMEDLNGQSNAHWGWTSFDKLASWKPNF